VQIAARHFVLLEATYIAVTGWQEARGTPREFGALCKALQAQRDLAEYEGKLVRLAGLRATVKELKAAAGSGSDAEPVTP
jgi:hypothetical protein